MEVNDTEFWNIAYRNNAATLLGVLRRYVKDLYIAKDLLHEVFITAIDKYKGFTGKGSFEGWMYRIAVNTALMYLRKERELQSLPENVFLMADTEDDDVQDNDVKSSIEAAGFSSEELLAVIDKLPEHHKIAFNMYVIDGFTHKEIGAELNISPGTSKSHLARARKKIQQLLYEDIMKVKKKDRRRASIFLLLFPAKENYIDKLYREGLSDFSIPPPADTSFLSSAVEQQAASIATSATMQTASLITSQTAQHVVFWGSKTAFIAANIGTAAVIGTACWLTMGDNSPLNIEQKGNQNEIYESIILNTSDSLIQSLDSTKLDNTLLFETNTPENFNIPESENIIEIESNSNYISEPKPKSNPVNSSQPPSQDTSDSGTNEEKPADHVVIKKQIIQQQTVIVRDTIIIYE